MVIKIKLKIFYLLIAIFFIFTLFFSLKIYTSTPTAAEYISENEDKNSESEKKFIKWVDFNVCYEALDKALKADVNSQKSDIKLDWIELLAYLGAKYGGNFSKYKTKHMDELIKKLNDGETMKELTEKMKYYDYYLEAYTAILDGFVGPYEIEIENEDNPEEKIWVKKYGLKAFSPIARGYDYHHYDDFGNSREYGYKRVHLGNDLLGQVGTPIIAVESGTIEALGWNQYGGWRIGIRSFDKKRYYYYAHLRKNFPYKKTLKEGDNVYAGDVIGYLGRTGYSTTENTNNLDIPHLHFGMQLIFDESQKESVSEIWIDVYNLIRLLRRNQSATLKNPETKDYYRIYNIKILD
jgi:murein DD-endopeptidase MepM/ murein hydrolase activator NlpD